MQLAVILMGVPRRCSFPHKILLKWPLPVPLPRMTSHPGCLRAWLIPYATLPTSSFQRLRQRGVQAFGERKPRASLAWLVSRLFSSRRDAGAGDGGGVVGLGMEVLFSSGSVCPQPSAHAHRRCQNISHGSKVQKLKQSQLSQQPILM